MRRVENFDMFLPSYEYCISIATHSICYPYYECQFGHPNYLFIINYKFGMLKLASEYWIFRNFIFKLMSSNN